MVDAGRQEILQTHIQKQGLPLGADVTVDSIAASTTGFTGADLANLINEAALLAGRSDKGNSRRQHCGRKADLCLLVADVAFCFARLLFGCRVWQANLMYALLLGPFYTASAEVI